MNATELAFLLDKSRKESYTSENLVGKAATMLRQQQAEIEVLKSVVYWLKENRPEVWDDIQKWRKL